MAKTSFVAFSKRLDDLVDEFRKDRHIITGGEIVGALTFKAHAVMVEFMEEDMKPKQGEEWRDE